MKKEIVGIKLLTPKKGGGVVYAKNFVKEIIKEFPEYEFHVFIHNSWKEHLLGHAGVNYHIVRGRYFRRFIYEQIWLCFWIIYNDVRLLISPSNIITFGASCKQILIVQNVKPFIKYPALTEKKDKLRLNLLRFFTLVSIKKATGVIYLSNTQFRIINDERIINEKFKIIYSGIDPDVIFKNQSDDISHYNIKSKEYILSVSTVTDHKNFENLIIAFAEFKRDTNSSIKLVIAGGYDKNSKYWKKLTKVMEREEIGDEIKFLGEVDYSKLPSLYFNSKLYINLSLMESFPLTPAEAAANRVPLILSDIEVFKELYKDHATFVHPKEIQSIKEAIIRLLNNEKLYTEYALKAFEKSKEFSWTRTVVNIISFIYEG